jgi:hypothetical protein
LQHEDSIHIGRERPGLKLQLIPSYAGGTAFEYSAARQDQFDSACS